MRFFQDDRVIQNVRWPEIREPGEADPDERHPAQPFGRIAQWWRTLVAAPGEE